MTGGLGFDGLNQHGSAVAGSFYEHSAGQRVNTDTVIVEALRRGYPKYHLTVIPTLICDLLAFAADGNAVAAPIDNPKDRLVWKQYVPANRRLDGLDDGLRDIVHFGQYLLEWQNRELILFVVEGRDGMSAYPQIKNQYLLSTGVEATNRLLIEAGRWTNELKNEVWVFDGGRWQQSHVLWESVQHSDWDSVILDPNMKDSIIKDVDRFYGGRETYSRLRVPWRRGILMFGPPGNGKTISLKALMHSLSDRSPSIPTLYVRTLVSFGGPEASLAAIFNQARRYAPCLLIFEDLDTIITPQVRSYFFNEVDGLKSNDGILIIGSTNHLENLDPGISKRPSRFDRKYLFPDPDMGQREQYARFWQRKLKGNQEGVDFPDVLIKPIAKITADFSFAYMQEAFVASLLAIAGRKETSSTDTGVGGRDALEDDDDDGDLEKYVLWKEMQEQVKVLKEEMDDSTDRAGSVQGTVGLQENVRRRISAQSTAEPGRETAVSKPMGSGYHVEGLPNNWSWTMP